MPAARAAARCAPSAELRTGDIVVHEDHGVARFAGFETRTVAGVTRDYLYLEYQGDDRVFVPTDQLAKISRYVGAGGEHPPLSKLGGSALGDDEGARAARGAGAGGRAARACTPSAGGAAGTRSRPTPTGSASSRQRFPFTETPDQREAIELVKADMEAPRPMDRLICGDVGYGKTEVALRAAFKAANDGKQVLMLVPTTILAQQHYGTFAERLADYPITLEHVSRFRSPAEQRAAVKGFAEGRVDILIGTHRVLSRDVRAKDLGLLIVDEEQRFGVKQKELLRQLKLKVDVISMSATPIPRTLQMSLAGLRDISVIETPPEGRRPIRTYVGEYEEELVKRAIVREHERGGQAFFLHNRVESIEETAERLRALCPGVRFAVAHGQMGEGELEAVMMDYLRGGADVLVCTSIIESGIDIPQANTLIVEHADTLRARPALPDPRPRGPQPRARVRLPAVRLRRGAHAGGGAAAVGAVGLHRARARASRSRCATSRSAAPGNLLGDEQSGHVAALGFELYMQMLDEAVTRTACHGAAAGAGGEQAAAEEVDDRPSRCASTSTSTPTCRPTTSPTSRPRSTCTGAWRARSRSPTGAAARGARGPLRPAARAAREPARAAARAHQVRPGGRPDGQLPRRSARGRADRARLQPRASACARSCPRRCMSPGARRSRCACRRRAKSVSRPS